MISISYGGSIDENYTEGQFLFMASRSSENRIGMMKASKEDTICNRIGRSKCFYSSKNTLPVETLKKYDGRFLSIYRFIYLNFSKVYSSNLLPPDILEDKAVIPRQRWPCGPMVWEM